jgi:hypothetical protein
LAEIFKRDRKREEGDIHRVDADFRNCQRHHIKSARTVFERRGGRMLGWGLKKSGVAKNL